MNEKKNIEEKFRDFLEKWPKLHALYVKYEEILVYLVVGVLTTLVSWGVQFLWNFVFYAGTAHPNAIQNIFLTIANWTSGVIFGYFANRKYVFRSHAPMGPEAAKFVGSRVSTFFLDLIIRQVFGTWLGIDVYVTTIISAVLVTIANYVFSKLLVFTKKK